MVAAGIVAILAPVAALLGDACNRHHAPGPFPDKMRDSARKT
jgi:hypothetical protein